MTAAASRGDTAQAPGGAPQVSQAGEQRLARVESLRAIAALGVCAAHAWGQAHQHGPSTVDTFFGRVIYGGGFGVFFFFALSGYLLFWPFARHYWGGGAALDMKRYAINRFVRIMPLYWAVVIILLIFQENGGTWDLWWRFMLLWENFSHSHDRQGGRRAVVARGRGPLLHPAPLPGGRDRATLEGVAPAGCPGPHRHRGGEPDAVARQGHDRGPPRSHLAAQPPGHVLLLHPGNAPRPGPVERGGAPAAMAVRPRGLVGPLARAVRSPVAVRLHRLLVRPDRHRCGLPRHRRLRPSAARERAAARPRSAGPLCDRRRVLFAVRVALARAAEHRQVGPVPGHDGRDHAHHDPAVDPRGVRVLPRHRGAVPAAAPPVVGRVGADSGGSAPRGGRSARAHRHGEQRDARLGHLHAEVRAVDGHRLEHGRADQLAVEAWARRTSARPT